MSHTFDGSTYLSAVRLSANVQFTAGIEIDGTLCYMPRSSHSQMELILPTARYQPADSTSGADHRRSIDQRAVTGR